MAAAVTATLAASIVALHERLGRPVVIGISGAQGSGKSTLALFLANWLTHEAGLSSVRLSLDDFYFNRQMRHALATTVHPLLATRGVPGTHDVELLRRTVVALTDTSTTDEVTLPVFDKASDDRVATSSGPAIRTPVDVVLFEGWCVGARPQKDGKLTDPVNELEARADPDRRWRSYVNERLRTDYARLFAAIDALVMLRVPSFDKVYEWRAKQERQAQQRALNDEQLAVFIMHYERLTRHMLETMPAYADTVIDIDDAHDFSTVSHGGWRGSQSPPG